jgi:hypothetical protein
MLLLFFSFVIGVFTGAVSVVALALYAGRAGRAW